ncbi:MAG: preprotein translocase subunit YajC [Planctomycetes bacterium]|nr:preprotein translocase subunit YajC [Planctomycetota bacterium]
MPYYILAQTTPPSTTPPAGAPAVPAAPSSTPAPDPAAVTTGTGTPSPAGAEQAPAQSNSMMGFLFMMGIMVFFIYFFLIRPQKKQEKERNKMLSAVKKNDKVLTSGGIYGTVHTVKEKDIIVRIDENTKVRFAKSAIVAVVEPSASETTTDEQPADANAQNN